MDVGADVSRWPVSRLCQDPPMKSCSQALPTNGTTDEVEHEGFANGHE